MIIYLSKEKAIQYPIPFEVGEGDPLWDQGWRVGMYLFYLPMRFRKFRIYRWFGWLTWEKTLHAMIVSAMKHRKKIKSASTLSADELRAVVKKLNKHAIPLSPTPPTLQKRSLKTTPKRPKSR